MSVMYPLRYCTRILYKPSRAYINANAVYFNVKSLPRIIMRNMMMKTNNCSSEVQSLNSNKLFWQPIRLKSKKKNTTSEDSDEDEDYNRTLASDKLSDMDNVKDVTCHVSSLRVDAIVKSGMGLPRNELETAFFDSRIRVNGIKLLKKSAEVDIGDEIDVVKGISKHADCFLEVTRIVITSIQIPKNENANAKIQVKVKRFKNLTIENYSDKFTN